MFTLISPLPRAALGTPLISGPKKHASTAVACPETARSGSGNAPLSRSDVQPHFGAQKPLFIPFWHETCAHPFL